MSEGKGVLMLTPAAMGSGRVPGAVTVTADCGHQAWISPSGLTLQLGGGVTTRCLDCVDPNDVTETEPVPGARDQLTQLLGPEAADAVIATATRNPGYMVRTLQAQSRRRRRR